MLDPWIGFLNELVNQPGAAPGDAEMEHACRRQQMLDRTALNFPFPLTVTFQALVLDRRMIQGKPYLVLGPTGLAPEAIEVLGGVVVPALRDLYPGAVVEARAWLADPDTYHLGFGVLAHDVDLDVQVPVEP